ncbi:MAG: putative zinc-binding protein [Methanomicrobiaceae archaeon]|nr:putative zinc-binding protein [Methanomicrobiaceae archaeon]
MADEETCLCGDTSAQTGKRRFLFPCAGQANTGQLSNLAAIQLTAEGYGNIACMALLATGDEGLKKRVGDADEVVVIDGCPSVCGLKIAKMQGITPGQHIVVTELGIKKAGSMDYTDDDLETVVSAAWEGAGRKE